MLHLISVYFQEFLEKGMFSWAEVDEWAEQGEIINV